MGYSINGITKTITLTPGTTLVSVRDIWSRWIEWFLTTDNSKFLPAFKSVGGDDIDVVSGTSIPIYVFLINGWRIKPQESNHTLTINDGILVVDGGGDPFINTTGSYIVRINYQQPVQAITVSTGGGSGGGATWTDYEKEQIRQALGIDGSKTASTGGLLQDIPSKVWEENNSLIVDPDSAGYKLDKAKGWAEISASNI